MKKALYIALLVVILFGLALVVISAVCEQENRERERLRDTAWTRYLPGNADTWTDAKFRRDTSALRAVIAMAGIGEKVRVAQLRNIDESAPFPRRVYGAGLLIHETAQAIRYDVVTATAYGTNVREGEWRTK